MFRPLRLRPPSVGISKLGLLSGVAAVVAMFASSEAGAFYDTSDISTLYTDTAGLTPALVGQPVGLRLDKRLGLVLGAEEAPAIDMVTGTDKRWAPEGTYSSTLSVVNGALRVTKTQAIGMAHAVSDAPGTVPLPTVIGKWYKFTVRTGNKTGAGNWDARVGTTKEGTNVARLNTVTHGLNDNTTKFTYFQATTATVWVSLISTAGAVGDYNDWLEASIRELPGNHAVQATTAAKPILRQHYDPTGADLKSSGFTVMSGSTTPATYDTSTGAGSSTRTDINNISMVRFSLSTGSTYIIDVSNTGSAQLQVRTNNGANTLATILPGGRAKVECLILAGNLEVRAAGDATSTTFTVHSLNLAVATDRTLGAELVANGGFDSAAGWNAGTNWTISGGVASHASGSTGYLTLSGVSPTPGAYYELTYTYTHAGTNGIQWAVGGTLGTARASTGTYTEVIVAGSDGLVRVFAGVDNQGSFDNVSLRQITNHGKLYLEYDGVDDFMRAAFAVQQPWDRISAVQQITWTASDHFFGGVTAASGQFYQRTSSPNVGLWGGAASIGTSAPLAQNFVSSERFAGASTRLAIDSGAYVTGDVGSLLPGGITIGANNAAGQCGNIRDYGLVMREAPHGAELVTNGDFSNGTVGWAAVNGDIANVGNQLVVTNNTALTANARPSTFTLTAGKTYEITFDVVALNGVTFVGIGSASAYTSVSGTGTGKVAYLTAITNAQLRFDVGSSTTVGHSITLDNVSVKEVTPLTDAAIASARSFFANRAGVTL